MNAKLNPILLFLSWLITSTWLARSGEFTVHIAPPPPPPTDLVRFDDSWRYHKGVTAPQTDWKTVPDTELDSTWATGPGGFGFGDNDDNTVLADMFNGYSTVYIRQSFHIDPTIDPDRHLELVVDFDDAFIAWLDGVEVARSANAPGEPGTEPPHTAIANPPDHEASNGAAGNPPETYDLGPLKERLAPGAHVLAVMGLNAAIESTDFTLIAGLRSSGAVDRTDQDGLFILVNTNRVVLTGTNTLVGSVRVTANGTPSDYNPVSGHWSHAHPLQPGMNHFFIAAQDGTGNILGSISKNLVPELNSVPLGGTITNDTTLGAPNSIVRLTADLVVTEGARLALDAGAIVLIPKSTSIRVHGGGALETLGTPDQPVWFLPADGTSNWGELSASGADASLILRHAQVVAGQIETYDGAQLLVEDPLPAPFNLAVLSDGGNTLRLTWEIDGVVEQSFCIERSTNGVQWLSLAETLSSQTVYWDDGAAPGQYYYYRVRAENAGNVSRWSNVAGGVRADSTVQVSGTLTRDMVWSPLMGTFIVTAPVVVPANITLTLQPGTNVSLTNNAGMVAVNGGTIDIAGTADQKVMLSPLNSAALWGELGASNANSSITIRHADISGGRTAVRAGAGGLFVDTYFHDFRPSSCSTLECPILLSTFAASLVVRRCHFHEYHETLFRDGVMTIEDSLFEYASGDALDFDGAQPGTILRRCTFRHGIRAPSNIDAVDVGPGQLGASRDVVIEDCLIYDFPTDKGVSIGDAPQPATGIVVHNCLIYGCQSGVQVKDNSVAEVYQSTIVHNDWGLTNYNKANPLALTGGGHTTNAHNNILWDNGIAVSMVNGSTLTLDYSNLGETNWLGVGNFSSDPLFMNSSLGDFRLKPDSPSRGMGRDGADMGAAFPVGAPMAASHPGFQSIDQDAGEVIFRFWTDSERAYIIQSSSATSGGVWSKLVDVAGSSVPRLVKVRQPIQTREARFYRLVSTRPQ